MSGEPQPKRAKSEFKLLDPIFTNFFRDKEKFEQLWSAVTYIKTCGWNKMIFRKINEANAREIVSFSNATCTLTYLDEDPGFVTVGAFFVPAINILEKYCCAHPSIPDNPDEQGVLSKLLQYLSSHHGGVLYTEAKKKQTNEISERLWAVMVAEHLISQLAMVAVDKWDKKYIIERYPQLSLAEMKYKYPCYREDPISGEKGDTSFGCLKGWHGNVDIMLEDMVVQVPEAVPAVGDQVPTTRDQVPTAEEDTEEDSDIEIEIDSALAAEMQLTAQSIVFSFLQNKYNKDRMKSRLVPAISITLKNYQLMCYDSEQDILVSTVADSPDTRLFDDTIKSLNFCSVVVLWMTLNYRLLCSGVPTNSKKIRLRNVKAEFFERVGDHLYLYEEAVERPAHVPCKTSSDAPEGQGKSMLQMFGDYEINTGFSPLPL